MLVVGRRQWILAEMGTAVVVVFSVIEEVVVEAAVLEVAAAVMMVVGSELLPSSGVRD